MAEDAGLELQRAVKNALEADASLATLMGGTVKFFDHVPEREEWPYLEYRATQNQEWDTDEFDEASGYGEQHVVSLNLWSSYEGSRETRRIIRRCREILQDSESMVLVDHNLVSIRWQFTDVVPEPDGQTYHGICQFRAITEET